MANKLLTNKAVPIIFSVLGAAGVIGCTVLTSIQTAKVCKALDKAKTEKGSELTKKEVVSTAASFYIPVAAADVATIGLIACSSALGYKQNMALVSGCAVMGNYINNYRINTATHVGVEEEAKINELSLAMTGYNYHCTGQIGNDRICRFVDSYSGNYVDSYERQMIDAFYHINRNFALSGRATMNQIYKFTGHPKIDNGDNVGFDCEEELYWVDVEFELIDATATPPVVRINYIYDPINLEEYM